MRTYRPVGRLIAERDGCQVTGWNGPGGPWTPGEGVSPCPPRDGRECTPNRPAPCRAVARSDPPRSIVSGLPLRHDGALHRLRRPSSTVNVGPPRMQPPAEPAETTTAAPALPRAMGFPDVVLFFITAGVNLQWVATASAAGPAAITIWLIAFVTMAVPLALAVVEMSSRYPQEGGMYVWSKR